MSPDTVIAASDRASRLENELKKVIRGKDEVVRLALVSVLAHGHLLIEGVPGVGKTTLAQALARLLGSSSAWRLVTHEEAGSLFVRRSF